ERVAIHAAELRPLHLGEPVLRRGGPRGGEETLRALLVPLEGVEAPVERVGARGWEAVVRPLGHRIAFRAATRPPRCRDATRARSSRRPPARRPPPPAA